MVRRPARGRDGVSAALAKEALAWRLRPERIGRLPKEKPPIHADERLVFRKRTNQSGGATRSRTGLDWVSAALAKEALAWRLRPERIGRLPKEKPPIHADERLVFWKRTNQFGGATRSRTGLDGFAIRCITALLSRRRVLRKRKRKRWLPFSFYMERETRLELATSTLARLRSTN